MAQEQVKKTDEKPKRAFPGGAGPGRPKGVPNKMTTAAKDAIAKAADALGGPDRLVEWVKEDPLNERAFWTTIYPKLIPLQVTGENGAPIETSHTITFIKPSHGAD